MVPALGGAQPRASPLSLCTSSTHPSTWWHPLRAIRPAAFSCLSSPSASSSLRAPVAGRWGSGAPPPLLRCVPRPCRHLSWHWLLVLLVLAPVVYLAFLFFMLLSAVYHARIVFLLVCFLSLFSLSVHLSCWRISYKSNYSSKTTTNHFPLTQVINQHREDFRHILISISSEIAWNRACDHFARRRRPENLP